MPSMIFLRRSWSFASDDFVLPGLLDLFSRLVCLIIIGCSLYGSDLTQCLPTTLSKVFFAILFTLQMLGIVLDIALSFHSSRGGVMDVRRRSRVPTLLLLVLLLSLVELVADSVCIYTFSKVLTTCGTTTVAVFIFGNGLRMCHIVHGFIWLMLHFRRSGSFWSQVVYEVRSVHLGFLSNANSQTTKRQAQAMLTDSVHRRLKHLLSVKRPSATHDSRNTQEHFALSSAATLFSEMFYDVDLVATDIAAGLLLLRWQTRSWVGSGHRVPISWLKRETAVCHNATELDDSRKLLSASGDASSSAPLQPFTDPTNWLGIHRIRRMAQLAISIYGAFFYYFLYRPSGNPICRLYHHIPCSPCCVGRSTDDPAAVYNPNCCFCSRNNCDLAAVLEITGLKLTDFVAINFDNTVFESPYFVALDDESQCIVIAVRGTLSIEDAVVDLLCDGVPLSEVTAEGTGPPFIGHRGMINSARRLFNRLTREGSIEVAKSKRPNYPLVVCGHSLGAGIASFLTLLLRPIYPEVKGYAMSCPLGTMSPELAEFCKPFLVTVIYGFDIFARMNIATIVDLKWRLLDALSGCPVPKYSLLTRGMELCVLRGISRCCCGCGGGAVQLPPTVGEDTRLLDVGTQQRLNFPRAPYSNSPRVAVAQGDVASTDDEWPCRLLASNRSLVRWLDPMKLRLFSSEDHKPSPKLSAGPASQHQQDQERYDMDKAVFGGRVLHIVDVDMEDHGTAVVEKSITSQDQIFEPYLLNESRNCCNTKFRSETTVAVWSSSDQFKTILVHPRMFNDHAPYEFYRAVNRVYVNAVGTPQRSPILHPADVFRRLV